MAQAVTFPEVNHSFGKPPTMTDNQCYTLPVCRVLTFIPGEDHTDKAVQVPAHISCWEFTDEEIDEIVRTRKGYLKMLGTQCYPVSLHGIKPIYLDDSEISDVILPLIQPGQPKEPKTPADPPPPPLHKAVG